MAQSPLSQQQCLIYSQIKAEVCPGSTLRQPVCSSTRHDTGSFISFGFSRAEAQTHGRWGERHNTAEGESAAGTAAPRTSRPCTNSQPGACSTLFASQRLSQPASDIQLKRSPLCIRGSAALQKQDLTSNHLQSQFVCVCDDAHEQTQLQQSA